LHAMMMMRTRKRARTTRDKGQTCYDDVEL